MERLKNRKSRNLSTFTSFFLSILVFLLFTGPFANAQNIPLGTWRTHLSYRSIHCITLSTTKTFAASEQGIMILDRDENSFTTFSKINGLTGAQPTWISFDPVTSKLLVGYQDGRLDVISNNEINSYDPAQNTTLTGTKTIHHITIRNGLAYLAADYGVVVFDLSRSEVKETWRDLGASGQTLQILQSATRGDSIFLATAQGVLVGDLDDNLQDFSKWKRFNTGNFNVPVNTLTTFSGKVYAGLNSDGLYSYESGSWTLEPVLQNSTFQSMTASATHVVIVADAKVWKVDATSTITSVEDPKITQPLFALEDGAGKMWVGDSRNGLVSNQAGGFLSFVPNGPSSAATFRMKYSAGRMFNVAGGFNASMQALGREGILDEYSSGLWNEEATPFLDLTDVATLSDDAVYASSFGYGLLKIDSDGTTTTYNDSNSPLVNLNPPGKFVNLTAIEQSERGIWVANYGANSSLHVLKDDDTWESFPAKIPSARYVTDLAVDHSGSIWGVINPAQGGGLYVLHPDENTYTYRNDQPGNGALPNKVVRSMAVDRDGLVWVGTELGVAYFFDATDEAIKPIFESRFLLRDDKVTAIAVDGGNRKWMGTERGVWLFNPTGEEMIYNFTAANSPLPSDVIRDIEIDGRTGEVFFITDKGIVSFRGDATESDNAFQSVKIFPNPVTADFTGTIGISGLATDAVVKITDISGKLVTEVQAQGGTATWNGQDARGRKAATGTYLVFAATPDGMESMVGKITVIN